MGDQQLKAWFDAIDVDHSGRLDSKELQRALAMGNLHYGLNDVVRGPYVDLQTVVKAEHLQHLQLACMQHACTAVAAGTGVVPDALLCPSI